MERGGFIYLCCALAGAVETVASTGLGGGGETAFTAAAGAEVGVGFAGGGVIGVIGVIGVDGCASDFGLSLSWYQRRSVLSNTQSVA